MTQSLENLLQRRRQSRDVAPQLADRRVRVSGGADGVQQLAHRTASPGARRPCCSISRITWRRSRIKGPDALKLCSYATINSFNNFTPGKAKQMVPTSHDGYVIGDGILFYWSRKSCCSSVVRRR